MQGILLNAKELVHDYVPYDGKLNEKHCVKMIYQEQNKPSEKMWFDVIGKDNSTNEYIAKLVSTPFGELIIKQNDLIKFTLDNIYEVYYNDRQVNLNNQLYNVLKNKS